MAFTCAGVSPKSGSSSIGDGAVLDFAPAVVVTVTVEVASDADKQSTASVDLMYILELE